MKMYFKIQKKLKGIWYDFDERRIFVMGNQKSGTSVIASLLALRLGEQPPRDIPFFWGDYQRPSNNNKINLEKAITQNVDYFSTKVVKEPCLTPITREIQVLFKNAQFVFIVRHPADNIRSIADRLNLNSPEILHSPPDRKKIPESWWNYLYLDDTNPPGKCVLSRLIARWNEAASVAIDNETLGSLLRYEDFCKDKITSIDKVLSIIGESANTDITEHLEKQYQPKGKGIPLHRDTQIKISEMCSKAIEHFNY